MLLGSDVSMDSRVKKSAASLAAAGLAVTVLSYTADGRPKVTRSDGVTLMEVPVPWRLKNVRAARRKARRTRQLRLFGFRTAQDERAAKLRVHLRRRELVAARGRLLARHETSNPAVRALRPVDQARLNVATLVIRGRSFWIRARAAAQRRLDRNVNRAWRVVDRVQSRITLRSPWRRVLPEAHDYEVAYGPIIDELNPDVIHSHDMQMIGVAAEAAGRARVRGKRVPWVYDAHEYVAGLALYGGRTPRWVSAWQNLEREFIRSADRVVTVSPEIADRLHRDYRLPRRPTVVLNCPVEIGSSTVPKRTIRDVIGLPVGVPLLAYAGGLTPARGLSTVIEGLGRLPDVHLGLVCVPHAQVSYVEGLRTQAEQQNVAGRVHFLDPVPPAEVSRFLSSADIAVHPMRHYLNHEVTLPNKIFEYIHAGIPVVVSDVKAMADLVRDLGIGEVFRADDPADFARAVQAVFEAKELYTKKTRDPSIRSQYSWEGQAARLVQLYEELLGIELAEPPGAAGASGLLATTRQPAPRQSRRPPRVVIGPANMAGQGWAWGRALERHQGVSVHVFAVDRGFQQFPADELVSPADFARSTLWQLRQVTRLLGEATHVLMEAGRPVFGTLNGRFFDADVPTLVGAGVTVALVFHGSEIRDPARHARHYPWSPFKDPKDPLTSRLQTQLAELKPRVESFDGPKFFSTPDLLDDVPDGIWLPVVVDTSLWAPGKTPLERDRPVVLHAPSRQALKGTQHIDLVLDTLSAEGLVEYRRIEGVPNTELPEAVTSADVVIDHIGIGNYGVFTCEAMAAGRVTLSHVHERVRERIPLPLPVIEVRPDTLEDVLRRVLADRAWALETTAAGREFVIELHDGRRSAEILAGALGLGSPTAQYVSSAGAASPDRV
jgi:glycosyltransferase involved in cell wall biosynthesis